MTKPRHYRVEITEGFLRTRRSLCTWATSPEEAEKNALAYALESRPAGRPAVLCDPVEDSDCNISRALEGRALNV